MIAITIQQPVHIFVVIYVI